MPFDYHHHRHHRNLLLAVHFSALSNATFDYAPDIRAVSPPTHTRCRLFNFGCLSSESDSHLASSHHDLSPAHAILLPVLASTSLLKEPSRSPIPLGIFEKRHHSHHTCAWFPTLPTLASFVPAVSPASSTLGIFRLLGRRSPTPKFFSWLFLDSILSKMNYTPQNAHNSLILAALPGRLCFVLETCGFHSLCPMLNPIQSSDGTLLTYILPTKPQLNRRSYRSHTAPLSQRSPNPSRLHHIVPALSLPRAG